MNPAKLFQLKNSWDRFTSSHPKLPLFLRAVTRDDVIKTDTVVEITVTTSEGRNFSTNVKLTPEDIQLLEEAREAMK